MTVEERLIQVQGKANELFDTAEQRNFFSAGQTEKQLSKRIYDLAYELHGIKKYWHKRIVRSGPNTLHPYSKNPPDLQIKEDDILFFDFGPVYEQWEVDLGRTYVLGNDPRKHQLSADITSAWKKGKVFFDTHPGITGAEFYRFTAELAITMGWEFGNVHCGHLIGKFPHERIQGEKVQNYIHPDNHLPMNSADAKGNTRHWIYEVHFIDRRAGFGGFVEELLTL